jgi:hypothetical protein
MHKYLFILLTILSFSAFGQGNHPQNGVKPTAKPCVAIKNVRIVVSPEKTIENGTILFRDGEIIEVGKLVIIPIGMITNFPTSMISPSRW